MKNQFKILCGAMALAVAGQVSAVANWTYTANTTTADSFTATASDGSGVTATAKGYANTGPLTPTDKNAGTLAQQTLGYLYEYSGGLGINNFDGCGTSSTSICTGDAGDVPSAAPEHAIDNDQRFEMVLFSFSKSVNLTNATIGWVGTDADYTLLAYTGSNPVLDGKTWADVGAINSGWTKINDYSNTTTGQKALGTNGFYSSYWLIGAYNPLGGTANASFAGADYLKLSAVTGNICTTGTGPNCTPPGKVPEPGSLALFGLALLGMLSLRKRQQA